MVDGRRRSPSQLDDEAATLDLGHEPLEDPERLGVELLSAKLSAKIFVLIDRNRAGLRIHR